MQDEDYLDVGRCPLCGKVLEQFYETLFHCYNCKKTWEKYQSYASRMWGPVEGWKPPSEKELFDLLDEM